MIMIVIKMMRAERKQVTYRVLYNHFLRNENGVTVNLWDSISSLVDQFVMVSLFAIL